MASSNNNSSNSNSRSSSPPPHCVKDCGFYGNSATSNMCSKCYKDFLNLTQESLRLLQITGKPLNVKRTSVHATDDDNDDHHNTSTTHEEEEEETNKKKKKIRCQRCKRGVGLTGFGCRCGGLFCGSHRYPDQHSCKFDHKTFERLKLAEQLPFCGGDKLLHRV